MRWIATNAGHEGSIVVAAREGDEGRRRLQRRRPSSTRIWSQAGVIDPTKVVRSALQNAASIASLLLTTEAVVSQLPEDTAPAARPDTGGFGGF